WLAPGRQAWCVHDKANGTVVALAGDSGDALPLARQLPERPASVSFTAMPEISTLVPQSSLVPGTELQHLKLVHGTVPTGLLRDEPIGTAGAQCIYLHDETAERKLLDQFPGARSLPLQAILVNHALSHSAEGAVAVLHRTATRLDAVLARGNQLLLSNTFFATTPEDVLYYALFCVKQCSLPPCNCASGAPIYQTPKNTCWPITSKRGRCPPPRRGIPCSAAFGPPTRTTGRR
ncbi:MAG TPA: DUF3822 family protein, partial [Flavobacteriales bacterium]|nr:DUF3822 family protein [Flavobacteriales bacterium]